MNVSLASYKLHTSSLQASFKCLSNFYELLTNILKTPYKLATTLNKHSYARGECLYWVSLLHTHTPTYCNQDKSAARFGRQLAGQVPNMFRNFYLVKSHIIANNSATTEPREKNKHRFGILRILKLFKCMFD